MSFIKLIKRDLDKNKIFSTIKNGAKYKIKETGKSRLNLKKSFTNYFDIPIKIGLKKGFLKIKGDYYQISDSNNFKKLVKEEKEKYLEFSKENFGLTSIKNDGEQILKLHSFGRNRRKIDLIKILNNYGNHNFKGSLEFEFTYSGKCKFNNFELAYLILASNDAELNNPRVFGMTQILREVKDIGEINIDKLQSFLILEPDFIKKEDFEEMKELIYSFDNKKLQEESFVMKGLYFYEREIKKLRGLIKFKEENLNDFNFDIELEKIYFKNIKNKGEINEITKLFGKSTFNFENNDERKRLIKLAYEKLKITTPAIKAYYENFCVDLEEATQFNGKEQNSLTQKKLEITTETIYFSMNEKINVDNKLFGQEFNKLLNGEKSLLDEEANKIEEKRKKIEAKKLKKVDKALFDFQKDFLISDEKTYIEKEERRKAINEIDLVKVIEEDIKIGDDLKEIKNEDHIEETDEGKALIEAEEKQRLKDEEFNKIMELEAKSFELKTEDEKAMIRAKEIENENLLAKQAKKEERIKEQSKKYFEELNKKVEAENKLKISKDATKKVNTLGEKGILETDFVKELRDNPLEVSTQRGAIDGNNNDFSEDGTVDINWTDEDRKKDDGIGTNRIKKMFEAEDNEKLLETLKSETVKKLLKQYQEKYLESRNSKEAIQEFKKGNYGPIVKDFWTIVYKRLIKNEENYRRLKNSTQDSYYKLLLKRSFDYYVHS